MTTTRILPAVVLVAIMTAGPAVGQYVTPSYSPPGATTAGPGTVPPYRLPTPPATGPVTMPAYSMPGTSAGQYSLPPYPPTSPPVPSVLPTGGADRDGPPEAVTKLNQLSSPLPALPPAPGDPLGPPPGPVGPPGLPPGSYGSPWLADRAGCCGPIGRHGPVVYELYVDTGPDFLIGGGKFLDRLNDGWGITGGGRSLFFNAAGDAAWVADLGLQYTYNRGSATALQDLFLRQRATTATTTAGATISVPQPDVLTTTRIRALHRTAFNYAFGRDWFLWGSGVPGGEPGWNLRTGLEVGGQWGTAHVDLVPNNNPALYSRRQNVYEGVFVRGNLNVEHPLGGSIWFGGLKLQIGYEWMNIVPPINGDVSYIDLMFGTGIRY